MLALSPAMIFFFFFVRWYSNMTSLAGNWTLKWLRFWDDIISNLTYIVTIKYFLIDFASRHTKRRIWSLNKLQFSMVGRKLTSIQWPCSLGYLSLIGLNFKGYLFTSFSSLTFKTALPLFYHKCLWIPYFHLVTCTKWTLVYLLLYPTPLRYLRKRHTA